ncbi:YjbH domain-containing protein [Thiomicrorhabdus sp.]|uniref:YjbH domain-containing protein n=1 Tax=Thiomicrorhabdus sp. TaxID=2039724 RepID=UPI0029C8F7D6|nr:YjbH domain-containing protein [Thiomicrorhabdus sp.]
MKKRALLIGLLSACGFEAYAQDIGLPASHTVAGDVGLVAMPTARMEKTGNFGVHFSNTSPYSRFVVFAQPLSWLEVLFKYTDISNRIYGAGSTQGYKDKSVDVKIRLLDEGFYRPEIALGMRDVGGTGLFSGEYLVASKQWGNFDFSAGIGWGYLGTRGHVDNPFGWLSDSMKEREEATSNVNQAGSLDSWQPFHGKKAAFFAGVSYSLESLPLTLKVEYDANDYQHEPLGNKFKVSTPVNAAVVYQPNANFDLQAGVVRGDTLMVGISLKTNFIDPGNVKYLDPNPEAILVKKPDELAEGWPQLAKTLRKKAGYDVDSIYVSENQVTVLAAQKSYTDDAKGIGRAARVLSNRLPEKLSEFHFVETANGMPLSEVSMNRNEFDDAARLKLSSEPVEAISEFSSDPLLDHQKKVYQQEADFSYKLSPSFSGSYGGPDAFLLYQLALNADATYRFRPNTWLAGGLELGVLDNYNEFDYVAPSNLPRVRTNIKEYLKTSKLRMSNLQLVNTAKIAPDWFAMGYIGYLESMYGGAGAEVLYRPFGREWSIGLDANYVKQRDFDQRFGFRDYSVFTGHVTGYYEGFEDVTVKLSAGRYLAKDTGATLDLSRKFRNGAKMGVWATKTDVTAEQFGEGSFDKGFYITLPFDLFTFKSTKQSSNLRWQFLTRDGGQKLKRQYNLYDMTEGRDLQNLKQSFDQVLD